MADYSSLSISFSNVGDGCEEILKYITELEAELNRVRTTFRSMTNSWEGRARAAFEEDFSVMSQSMSTTTETMRDVTFMIQKYNQSHEEVENGFGSGSHVTLG